MWGTFTYPEYTKRVWGRRAWRGGDRGVKPERSPALCGGKLVGCRLTG